MTKYEKSIHDLISGSSSHLTAEPVSYTHLAHRLNIQLALPPTLPLHPVIPDNACSLRITAAAGT